MRNRELSWRRLRVVRLLPELDYGGVESRVTLQSRLHTREEVELRVCTFHKAGAAAQKIRSNGVRVDVLDVSPAVRNPRASLALARYLRVHRPDIVHASIVEANFHALAVGHLSGVPIVIAEETGMPSHGRTARLAFAHLYRGADAIVGVTQAVCDYVLQVDRAPSDRVQLLYNCAHPDYFPERQPLPNRNATSDFLMVGRLVSVKNHETLLRAFVEVQQQRPSARLRIAGDGPLREPLERLAEELGIGRNVEFLGFRRDVRELLANSRAFLLPSLSEGCSVALIEAMATGVPVLGSRVPGILEVMGESIGAEWTAQSTDVAAWTKLLLRMFDLSPDARYELALAGQARAYSLFAPNSYVKRVEQLYRRLSGGLGAERERSSAALV